MAAKRFRERKKEKESVAMQRYDELQKTNTELKQQMKWLSEEIQVLRRLLVQRECIYYRATKRYHKIEG